MAGRWEKAMSDKTHMHGGGESYSGVLPAKQPNKSGRPPAEVVEERPLTKENAEQSNPCWTPSQTSGPIGLDRVRKAAKKDGKLQFTALLHHVNIDLLRDSYYSLKKQAAPGVDGVKWEEDFPGFSYGFRPGRSQHDALAALYVGIVRKKVNWVLALRRRALVTLSPDK
jgi:hypothetical protein